MRGDLVSGTSVALLVIILAVFFMPVARAQYEDPDYDVVFGATTPQSVTWRSIIFGMMVGSTHIYGNFSIALTNPKNVDYVVFSHTVGVGNGSHSSPFYDGDLMLNDSSEPFEWVFNTLDFSVGLHTFHWEAYHWESYAFVGHALVGVGGSFSLYLEHEDRSYEEPLYSGLSTGLLVGLLIAGVPVTSVVIYRHLKKQPRKEHDTDFGRDFSHD